MLERLHPYPAMLASEVAEDLADRFAVAGSWVVDPFCGTGRALQPFAARGAKCLGVDVNPLALLIARARQARASTAELDSLLRTLPVKQSRRWLQYGLSPASGVSWFTHSARRELCALIDWLRVRPLRPAVRTLTAAVLSAAARECSFARQDQWKLHRIPKQARRKHRSSPLAVFRRRLRSVREELAQARGRLVRARYVLGDSRGLHGLLRRRGLAGRVDLVVTSPPYGDSRTTVHYGGVSALCLGVVANLAWPGVRATSAAQIDRRCLGGRAAEPPLWSIAKSWWSGGECNPQRALVSRFIDDVALACQGIVESLKPGGKAILIVSRRRIGGFRLYLDRIYSDMLGSQGMSSFLVETRQIRRKVTPPVVNRKARCQGGARGRTKTMRSEIVLGFVKD